MRRQGWFELHDHRLFPGFLRDLVTDALQAMWNTQNSYGPVVPRLQEALRQSRAERVIDLCSGAGGPWLRLGQEFVRRGSPVPAVLLTDKYPNQQVFRGICTATEGQVEAWLDPVDAAHLPRELTGFRTIFSAFHHFDPDAARAILQDAFAQRQGIAIFEAAQRDLRTVATVFLVPWLAWWLAPGVRPFRWSRLFWTYVLPVIPFTLWFDGILSCLRSYSKEDLEELTEGLAAENYRWEMGVERGRVVRIRYLIGCPVGKAIEQSGMTDDAAPQKAGLTS